MSMMTSARRLAIGSAKAVVERSLAGSGVSALALARRRGDVLVLAYHNVVPDGAAATGDQSLHLPQLAFARQLDSLLQTHDIVPLRELFAPPKGARPRVVITFDDAYTGALTAGLAELAKRGLPATFFVTPTFTGGGTFWWDEIADPRLGCVPAHHRDHCLNVLQGRTPAVLQWAVGAGIARNEIPDHQRGASDQQLAHAAAVPGITLASHTWSHANLAALTRGEIEEELERPMTWLRERFELPLPWVSYPYGLFSPEVEDAARRLGYQGGLRVDGGWLSATVGGVQKFALPRLNVPSGLTQRGFELRAAGLSLR